MVHWSKGTDPILFRLKRIKGYLLSKVVHFGGSYEMPRWQKRRTEKSFPPFFQKKALGDRALCGGVFFGRHVSKAAAASVARHR